MKQKRREGKERKEGIKEGKYDGKVRERRKKRERQGKTEERRKEKEKKWLSIGRDRKSAFCRLSVSR